MSEPSLEETIAVIARVAGVKVLQADIPSLSAAFANQLEAIAALEGVDTQGVESVMSFDPRWL